MLLIGGHGGGKSTLVKHLGRMFTGLSMAATEECIIRAHPQLTEEKMIATLNIAKLMQSGEEEVLWRTFTTSFWKILDEVNRLSPYAQNMLLKTKAKPTPIPNRTIPKPRIISPWIILPNQPEGSLGASQSKS